MKHSKETKEKIAKKVSEYIKKHPEHGGLHYWKGKKMSEKTRKKMKESARKSKNSGKFKKGSTPWNKNKDLPEMLKLQISRTLEGRTVSRKTRTKMSESNRGKHSGIRTTQLAYERILEEIPALEKEGYRCIPIGKIIPDIIAIRDGKIIAIEVEYTKNPRYEKYKYQKIYDDVIWILKHPYARKQ